LALAGVGDILAGLERELRADARAQVGRERLEVAFVDVARHGLTAAATLVLDRGARAVDRDPRDLGERHERAVACAQLERADVLAVDADGDRRGLAGQRFADAVAEERLQVRVEPGVRREDRVDALLRRGLFRGRARRELDVELAAVRSPRILAELRAADLLGD